MITDIYINIKENVKDEELIKILLRLARQGDIDVRVSLSRNVFARHAPCNLSYMITQNVSPRDFTGLYETNIYEANIPLIEELERNTDDSIANKNFFRHPSEALPDLYDFEHFTISDLVYPGLHVFFDLEKVGRSEFNCFVSPEKTRSAITRNLFLYDKKIDEVYFDDEYNFDGATILIHQILITQDNRNTYTNKPISFYTSYTDAHTALYSLSETCPISIHAAQQYLQFEEADFIYRHSADFFDKSWIRNFDQGHFHNRCGKELKILYRGKDLPPLYLLDFLSYLDKWMPHNPTEPGFLITISDVYINPIDLNIVNNLYTDFLKNKSKASTNTKNNKNNNFDVNANRKNNTRTYRRIIHGQQKKPTNYPNIRYKYFIAGEFIKELAIHNVGKNKKLSRKEDFIDEVLHELTIKLNKSKFFRQLFNDNFSQINEVTSDEIHKILIRMIRKQWPNNDDTFDFF